jgi:hypothetical protein
MVDLRALSLAFGCFFVAAVYSYFFAWQLKNDIALVNAPVLSKATVVNSAVTKRDRSAFLRTGWNTYLNYQYTLAIDGHLVHYLSNEPSKGTDNSYSVVYCSADPSNFRFADKVPVANDIVREYFGGDWVRTCGSILIPMAWIAAFIFFRRAGMPPGQKEHTVASEIVHTPQAE